MPFSLAFSLYDVVVPLVISSYPFCFHRDNHTMQCSVFLRVRAMTCWPSSIWPCLFVLIVRLYACMPPAGRGSISPCAHFELHSRLNDSHCYPRRMRHANPTVHTLWKSAARSTLFSLLSLSSLLSDLSCSPARASTFFQSTHFQFGPHKPILA
jgi:hypothetical protein